MKNRSELLGIFFLVCAFVFMLKLNKPQSIPTSATPISQRETSLDGSVNTRKFSSTPDAVSPATLSAEENVFTLTNDVITVAISDVGGIIKSVQMNKFQEVQGKPDPVIFNAGSGVGSLSLAIENPDFQSSGARGRFHVTHVDDTSIRLERQLDNGCVLTRKYYIPAEDDKRSDGYSIVHDINITNNSTVAVHVGTMSLFMGTMPVTASDTIKEHLNFGVFNGQKDFFVKQKDFRASGGFFGVRKRAARAQITGNERIIWGAIKNQFFTTIVTPSIAADGYVTYPMKLYHVNAGGEEECDLIDGIAGELLFNVGYVKQNDSYSLTTKIYAGPKDFSRLSALGDEQDRVMQFGFFGSISELLLRLMLKIHSFVPNWGWTIIILTSLVKLVLWPLTRAQVRSSKKMSAIQGPMKLIKEKFKNNPKKLQAETVKLFKENGINPAAGCLPIFIQIPIFFGLYYMLRTAADLRFAHFLWINDLSLPDTIAHIGRFPVNILPIIMGGTMALQMSMTPAPAVENFQKTLFKLMPVIFLLCCYNFPSGLVLYWTVQNLLTVLQQVLTSRGGEVSLAGNSNGVGVGDTARRKKNFKSSVRKRKGE